MHANAVRAAINRLAADLQIPATELRQAIVKELDKLTDPPPNLAALKRLVLEDRRKCLTRKMR